MGTNTQEPSAMEELKHMLSGGGNSLSEKIDISKEETDLVTLDDEDGEAVTGAPKDIVSKESVETTNISDLDEYEEDVVDFFVDKFSAALDMEIDAENKPKNVNDVIAMISKVVENNSTPTYSSDNVRNLDEFVKNGGKFEDYYNTLVVNRLPLEDIDIDLESHQKAVIKEDLMNKGFKESQIDKKLRRLEDAGLLDSEAEEALESVREYREETQQKLLEDQKKQKVDYEKAQQKFFTSVDKTVKDTKELFGVPFTDKNKKETLEYVFKPDSDGQTKFFKETGLVITHNTNPKYLLETAYYAKFGSDLVSKLERKVESQAAKNLKEKLATKGTRGVNQGNGYNSSANMFSLLGSKLLAER